MFESLWARRRPPVLLHGVDAVQEGFAKKFRFPDPDDASGETMREVLVCRLDGRLHALDSACPHAGGRLAEGPLMGGRFAHCPLHLYKFDPKNGAVQDVDCERAKVLRIREVGRDARIWP